MDTPTPTPDAVASPSLTGKDWLFILSVVAALGLVAYLGTHTYKDAMKTETTKRNGEALVQWMQETAAARFAPDFANKACAGTEAAAPAAGAPATAAAPAPAPTTWGACLKSALTQDALKDLGNPFKGKTLDFAPACNPEDHSLAGSIVLEKITATPPGSAIPSIVSPLTDDTPIDQKVQLKLSVCDKGAYAVKVAEFEF